jgi:hypothetical protein
VINDELMKSFSNVLLVSGSGRNCGKTTLVCDVIKMLSATRKVVGLKISPHVHITGNMQELIDEGEGWKLYRETDSNSGKDSSRMLVAGASDVYFAESGDDNLINMANSLGKLFSSETPVVCESGSFAKSYKPGLHVLVKGNEVDETKLSYLANLSKADIVIEQGAIEMYQFVNELIYNGSWEVNK